MIGQTRSKQRFGRHRSALVQKLAALLKNRVVGDLLREGMLEDVFDIAGGRLLVDELAQLEVIEQAVEFVIRFRHHRSNQR
jgi:hypothetical protein